MHETRYGPASRAWRYVAGLATVGLVISGGAAAAVAEDERSAIADCVETTAVAATATSDDGNTPANAIDGDLGTRWSASPVPQAITVDFGSTQSIYSAGIAWYEGASRVNTFTVATSVDGSTFTDVHAGTSSGSSTQLETYAFEQQTSARYLRVQVTDTTNNNDWASITEIIANPEASEPPDADPNGVAQIYPSKTGKAEPWTLGFGDWQARFDLDGGSVSGEGKDTIISNNGSPRMDVFATEEVKTCEGNEDYAESLDQGYACSPNDWNDLEMTGYVRLRDSADSSSDQDWTFYGPSGTHTNNGQYPDKCWGHSYKGSYHYRNAQVRFGKETWHVNYDYGGPAPGWVDVPGGIDYGDNPDEWLGMKFIRYHFTRNGQEGIRVELRLDLSGIDDLGNPANDWSKVLTVEDHPDGESWGEDATDCDAPNDDQILLWGDPRATFRWDNTDSQLRLASVREIQPPAAG